MKNGVDKNGMFPHRDKIIEQAIAGNETIEDIISNSKGEIFTKEDIVENFYTYIDKIKNREKSWDIKISSFIMSHYKTERLFYDIGHPAEAIVVYIANCILEMLGITENTKMFCSPMDAHENPIYPCVQNALELNWHSDYIRKSKYAKKFSESMDLEEYIREYIAWCHPEIFV